MKVDRYNWVHSQRSFAEATAIVRINEMFWHIGYHRGGRNNFTHERLAGGEVFTVSRL